MGLLRHLAALSLALATSWVSAGPLVAFTFDFEVTSGTNSVASTFQRIVTLSDFSAVPTTFNFGGGNSMVKASGAWNGTVTISPFADEMKGLFSPLPFTAYEDSLESIGIYAELAYYLPGGSPATASGQMRVTQGGTRLIPNGNGKFFYDNAHFSINLSGQHELATIDAAFIADWIDDVGTIYWGESASRQVCDTATQGPCTFDRSVGWSGTAKLARFEVLADPAQVPEPGSLALLGIGLIGLAATRRRRP